MTSSGAVHIAVKQPLTTYKQISFCEKCLTALQLLLRSLAVVDIGVGPEPSSLTVIPP